METTESKALTDQAYAQTLESISPYLMSIAADRLPRDLWAKVAPSDIVQEALFEASRTETRVRGEHPAQLKAWLRKIVLNKVIDAHRRFQVTYKRGTRQELPLTGLLSDAIVSADTSPSLRASNQENNQRLIAALATLPDDQREAIVFRDFDGMSFAEIGERMSRSSNAARSLWWRAVESLRVELETKHDG